MKKTFCVMDFTIWGEPGEYQYVARDELKDIMGSHYINLLRFMILNGISGTRLGISPKDLKLFFESTNGDHI